MTRPRLMLTALILCAVQNRVPAAHALDIAPGTTSPTLEAEGCITASGTTFGDCNQGCGASCDLALNTSQVTLDISNYTVGRKHVEATAYSDFTVAASPTGAATSLDATISYDIAWAGGWTLGGVFTGFNDVGSTITLTLTDLTAGGTVVRSSVLHTMDVDGFIGIDIIDVGFGLDRGATVNTMDVRVVRGHSYRLGMTVRCEGKGLANAVVIVDYTLGDWGVKWNDLRVTVEPDLLEEIEKLKRRVDALEKHTHTYLTGRGEGHNNTEAETSRPILVVEDPSEDELSLLPDEVAALEPLPDQSVFLGSAPNPFHGSTTILYTLPEPLRVTIRLYNAQGQLAGTLVEADRPAGPHAHAFDASALPSGVYYYRLSAGRFVETRKLTLVR